MARPRTGTSPHTHYRRARERLADLEKQYAKIERTRPRTPGKKGAKTRALRTLARQLRAARGQLTKARNAISQRAHTRSVSQVTAKQRRSEAAKKGWAKRKAGANQASLAPPARAQRFLEESGGEVKQILVACPSKSDRSAVTSYWNAIGVYRGGGSARLLDRFNGRFIYDALSDRRLPFVTNTALLPEAIAAGFTDFDDLYTEIAWARAA